VAVLIGHFLGGETLGLRTIVGALLVLTSVLVIATTRSKEPAPALSMEETG
jgi:drug/metabolite transporter (DMT)-like permease